MLRKLPDVWAGFVRDLFDRFHRRLSKYAWEGCLREKKFFLKRVLFFKCWINKNFSRLSGGFHGRGQLGQRKAFEEEALERDARLFKEMDGGGKRATTRSRELYFIDDDLGEIDL